MALPLGSAAAWGVVTSINVSTSAGPALEGATLRIVNSDGEVVDEEKTDVQGVILLDLPDGEYTAMTIDGRYSTRLYAGDAVSIVAPVLYGILDNVSALADYFAKFSGSAAERDAAWSLMSDDVARQVQARIGAVNGPRPARPGGSAGDSAAPRPPTSAEKPTGAAKTGGEGGRSTESSSGPGSSTTKNGPGGVPSAAGAEAVTMRPGSESTANEAAGVGARSVGGPISSTAPDEESGVGGARSGAGGGDAFTIGSGTQSLPPIEYQFYPRNQPIDDHTWTDPRDGTAVSIGDPTGLNPPGTGGETDSLSQKMVIELSVSNNSLTIPANSRIRLPLGRRDDVWVRRDASSTEGVNRAVLRWRPGFAPPGLEPAASPAILLMERLPLATLARAPTRPSSAERSPAAAVGSVTLFLTNTGGSTGEVFQADIVNQGSEPVILPSGALVVEPLEKKAWKNVQKQISKLGRSAMSLKVQGYCLEFLKLPPVAGQIFRVASGPLQQKFEPVRRILDASRKLFESGELNPDINAEEYFQSIRQWALWTEEQNFDEASFLDAFVEHTRKNMVAAGRQWEPRFESALRGALGGRWSDIQRILRESGL